MIVELPILKKHIGGVQSKLNFDTVEGFVRIAEREFRRTVGNELYQYLDNYNGTSADELELLEVAQGCIAWAAFDKALPHLKQRVGDLGIAKASPANSVAITKWEYVDMRESNTTMVDLFWEFFWELIDEIKPTVWLESNAYKARNEYFIRTADELTKYIPLVGRNRRFFATLLQYIHRAEQLYIADLLTESVFDDLKARFKDSSQTLSATELKLIEKIREPLALLTIYEAYPYLPIKVDEAGLRQVRKKDGTQEEDVAEKTYREAQRRQLWQDAQLYMARLRDFMNKNASSTQFVGYHTANSADPGTDDDFTYSPHVIL